MTSALQILQLYAVGAQPFLVGVSLGQTFFDFSVVIDFAFLSVDEQEFSWLQTSFLGYLSWLEVHHAYLACHYHHALVGDGVSAWTKSVSVEHTTCVSSIAKEQGCRSVPRFHQDGVVLIESLQFV